MRRAATLARAMTRLYTAYTTAGLTESWTARKTCYDAVGAAVEIVDFGFSAHANRQEHKRTVGRPVSRRANSKPRTIE